MPRAREIGIQHRRPPDRSDELRARRRRRGARARDAASATSRRRPTAAARAHRASPRWCWPRTPTRDRWLPAAPCSTAPASAPGSSTRSEWGLLETPIYLTSTMQLGRVYDAACPIALEQHARVADEVVIPVVGECDDSFLNDCRRDAGRARRRRAAHRRRPRVSRRARPPAEGAVGAGHRDVLPGLQGRHRYVVAGHPRGAHGGGAAAHQLRRAQAADRRRACRVGRAAARGRRTPSDRQARASASSSPTHRSPAATAPGSRAGSGSGWRAPGRPRTTAAARSSWRLHDPARPTATAHPERGRARRRPRASTTCSRPWSTPPRRRCSTRCSRAPTTIGRDGNTQRGPRPRDRGPADCRRHGVPGTEHEVRIPMARRGRARRHALPPRRADGPQPCLLEALPYRKDDLTSSYAESLPAAARRARVRRVPGRPARHRLVGGRRHRRVPRGRAVRPGRGDRLAGRPALVRRQRRHVGHVVLRLQLAADRLRAAAGAQGRLRDLRQRRPVDRRRALARRRAAAGRPRRLLPLHDADVRCCRRCRRSGATGWREEWRRRLETGRAVGAHLAAREPRRSLLAARLGARPTARATATTGSSAR